MFREGLQLIITAEDIERMIEKEINEYVLQSPIKVTEFGECTDCSDDSYYVIVEFVESEDE